MDLNVDTDSCSACELITKVIKYVFFILSIYKLIDVWNSYRFDGVVHIILLQTEDLG